MEGNARTKFERFPKQEGKAMVLSPCFAGDGSTRSVATKYYRLLSSCSKMRRPRLWAAHFGGKRVHKRFDTLNEVRIAVTRSATGCSICAHISTKNTEICAFFMLLYGALRVLFSVLGHVLEHKIHWKQKDMMIKSKSITITWTIKVPTPMAGPLLFMAHSNITILYYTIKRMS